MIDDRAEVHADTCECDRCDYMRFRNEQRQLNEARHEQFMRLAEEERELLRDILGKLDAIFERLGSRR